MTSTRPATGPRAQVLRRRAAWWSARALRTVAQILVNRERQRYVKADAVRFAMGDLEARLASDAIRRRDAAALRLHARQMERHFLWLAAHVPHSGLLQNARAVAADLAYEQRRFRLARALFSGRRKMIRTGLRRFGDFSPGRLGSVEKRSGVSLASRPEELDVAAWCRLADAVEATA